MQLTEISVTYRKKVNDNNYGDEAVEVTLSASIDADDDGLSAAELATILVHDARRVVYARLDESPSPAVRQGLRVPKTGEASGRSGK